MGLGATTPMKRLAASIVMTIPSAMVFLSLALGPRLSRALNIVFGTIYSLLMLTISANSLSVWKTFYVYFGITEVMITLVIVYYAWTWPTREANR